MKDVFSKIYREEGWGFLSGAGSNTRHNTDFVDFLKKYILDNDIVSVVDLGSGDFRVSGLVFLDMISVKYTGVDCVSPIIRLLHRIFKEKEHINFVELDFFQNKEDIPCCDLIIIKDVLQHWPNVFIYNFMDYITESSICKKILVVNSKYQKEDDEDIDSVGDWRQLSAKFLPLKKYEPKILYHYIDKEVSEICVFQK